MPDIQPIDIAIFLVSFAACIYCIVLSRRLKSLQDTRDGLGATIMAMNKSVSAISSATIETRAQAGQLADRLSRLMKEADERCDRLSSMIEALEAQGARAASPRPRHSYDEPEFTQAAPQREELVRAAQEESSDLQKLINEMRVQQDRLRSAAKNNELLFEDDDTWQTRSTN